MDEEIDILTVSDGARRGGGRAVRLLTGPSARARTRVSWLGVCREVADALHRARRRAPRSTRGSQTVDAVRHGRTMRSAGGTTRSSASRGRVDSRGLGLLLLYAGGGLRGVGDGAERGAAPFRAHRDTLSAWTLRETDEVVRVGVATRAAAGGARGAPAAGARHKTLAVTDAMVRCGRLRGRTVVEGGAERAGAEALETEISQIPDFARKLAAR